MIQQCCLASPFSGKYASMRLPDEPYLPIRLINLRIIFKICSTGNKYLCIFLSMKIFVVKNIIENTPNEYVIAMTFGGLDHPFGN